MVFSLSSGERTATAPLLLLAWTATFAALTGCHRSYYRRKADEEAYQLVREKTDAHHWPLKNYTIQVDPRSRMYSPDDPDRPPMPPDDPAAHQLMRRVDHKPGYPFWDAHGHTPLVENPDWLCFLPLDENGVLKLNADGAVRVARVNSPDFQQQLEELYLSALDVSFERFLFDSQLFAGYSAFFTSDGPDRSGSGGQPQSVLDLGFFSLGPRPVALRKMGITGSELVIGLANRLVWQFSGPDTHTATTLLDFSLVQPLLRNAGRDRILERLTLAERTLLANVRQMERFRRGFYVEVMTGRDAGAGPNRRGGVFGGSGLTGFSGVGGGGFGQLTGGRVGAGGAAAGAGAGQAGGFMGLLQIQQQLRNQETNIAQLRSSLAQFEAFAEAGRIDYLQVQQVRQQLSTAESTYLNSKTNYQDQLDQFKITLGLPPQLEVKIEDPMLDQLNLLDTALVPMQNRLTDLQQRIGKTVVQILDQAQDGIGWTDQLDAKLRQIQGLLAQADAIRRQVATVNVRRARDDLTRLRASLPQRVRELNRLRRRVEQAIKETETPEVDLRLLDPAPLKQLPDQLEKSLAELVGQLDSFRARFEALSRDVDEVRRRGKHLAPDALRRRLQDGIFAPIANELMELDATLLQLLLVQARARTDSVTLVPVELDSNTAIGIARDYRRDWMNRRAALVDAWRLIEFNADNLESTVDIVFEGDISNRGDNPLRLDDKTGRLRAGIQFDAPLVRLDERNTYRQALIEYQQARRASYVFRDQVARGLRTILRSMELNQLNFELRREAIHVAVEQVELARLRLQEPPKPDQPVGAQLGATTARDLVSALADLLDAQNDFLSVWISYEVLRRSLDFDLGTMRLDDAGIWLDPGPISPEFGYPAPGQYHAVAPDVLILPTQRSICRGDDGSGEIELLPPP